MALCVGLDVSLKTVSICIVKADGTVVWEGKALSEPACADGRTSNLSASKRARSPSLGSSIVK